MKKSKFTEEQIAFALKQAELLQLRPEDQRAELFLRELTEDVAITEVQQAMAYRIA